MAVDDRPSRRAPADGRPRNPPLVRDVDWPIALGPVPTLCREVRARLPSEVRRNVEGILVGQNVVLAERHVGLRERGGGVQPCHARSDVEGPGAPQRREQIFTGRPRTALPVGSVTRSALLEIERSTSTRVRGSWCLDTRESAATNLDTGRHVSRQPPHVGKNPVHLVAIGRQGLPIHGSLETIVDPLLQGVDLAIARSIFGKDAPQPYPWRGEGLCAGVQVTAGTIEPIPDIGAGVDLGLRENLLPESDALSQGALGDGSLVRSAEARRGPPHLMGLGTERLSPEEEETKVKHDAIEVQLTDDHPGP